MSEIKQIESPSDLEVTDPVKIRMTMRQYGKEWSTKDENSKQARIKVGDKVYDFGKVKEVGQTKSGTFLKFLIQNFNKKNSFFLVNSQFSNVKNKSGIIKLE